MRKALRLSILVLALTLATPVVAYAVYDFTHFQPQHARIAALINGAAPQEKEPHSQVAELLRVSLANDTAVYASRLLIGELGILPERHSMTQWHLHGMLWWSLVSLHLSESERVTLILALAPTGRDRRGVAKTAEVLYGVPLSELSLEQAATIIALTKVPGYADKPESLERIKQNLLRKYQARVQQVAAADGLAFGESAAELRRYA